MNQKPDNFLPTQPGIYEVRFLTIAGKMELVFNRQDSLEAMLQDAKLWRWTQLERVFYCDQCTYFATDAAEVQRHNEREHECRWETYQDAEGNIRVKTIKCHPRVTVKQAKTQAWGALRR